MKFNSYQERPSLNGLQYITRVIKIVMLFLIVGISNVFSSTYSQTTLLSLNIKNQSIKEVIKTIEKETEYVFFFSDKIKAELERKVSVTGNSKTIGKILDEIFAGTTLSYLVKDRQVSISRKAGATNSIANQKQTRKLAGIVKDREGEPIIGASVVVKNSTNGVMTDIDGRFEMQVPNDAIIEISYIGYTKQEIRLSGQATLNIVLEENAVMLKDVVAIGYATGSKHFISGAVQKVGKENMNAGVVNTPLEAIQGRVAGVNVQVSSSDPTTTPAIRIRGTTSLSGGNNPLVVIDGVIGDLNMLSSLSPSDIESFTILKDASETAQYGSRGASGVIVVTTQKGKYGIKSLSYDGTFGIQTVAKRIHSLDANEYRNAVNDRNLTLRDEGYNTDFMDEILQTGYTQNHKISFGKGDEDSNYNVSLGIIDQKGIVETTFKQRYNLKIDVAQSFFDNKLKLESGVFASRVKTRSLNNSRNTFYGAITMNPTYPNTQNEDGTWPRDPIASEVYNPLDLLTAQQYNRRYDATAHVRGTWTIIDRLKLSAFGSFTVNDDDASIYLPIKSRDGMMNNGGRGERKNGKNENYLGNVSLSYITNINKHYLNVLGLVEGQEYKSRGFNAVTSSYSTDYSGANNLGGGAVINYGDVGSYSNTYKLISLLGRINYVFDQKYIATINMRGDGSSKLGENNKWGFFPSFSLAWNMANEHFIKESVSFVDELKVRASYGITGNQDAISPYNSLQLLGVDGSSLITVNGNKAIAYKYLRNANPDLKWETKKTFDIGFDASLLNNKLSLTFDYYNSKTDDLLYTYAVPQPPFMFNQLLANIGSMKNMGVELSVGYAAIKTKDIGLDVSANISYQKNEVTSLTGTYKGQPLTPSAYVKLSAVQGAGIQGNNAVVYMFEGQPLGVFYLPKTDGLIDKNGKNEYNILDIDGEDGVNIADGKDRYIAGQAMPKYYLGTNIKFRYKAFDIQTQLNGAFGHKIYNGTGLTLNNLNNFPAYNVLRGAPERNIYDSKVTDYWLESGDYLHIAYLTLGYNINTEKYKNWLKSIRLTASVNNLCTFTSYSGLTPMINSSTLDSNNNTFGNDDKRFHPVSRTFSLGLSVNFKKNRVMKKIYYIIATLLFSLNACSLDETPIDQIPEEEAYKTPELVYINAVAGLYNDIRNLVGDTWDMGELCTDEAMIPTRGGDWFDGGKYQALFTHNWAPSLDQFRDAWNNRYTGIGKCNQSLKIVEKAKLENPSATFYDSYIAEIRAIRAIHYYYLLDHFGRIPISTSVDVSVSEVKQSKRSEVYDFLKKELDDIAPDIASGYSSKNGEYYGRMTKASIYFLLAKLAINAKVYSDDNWESTGDNPAGSTSFVVNGTDIGAWAAVKHYCDLIKAEGYKLQSDFSSNFSVNNEGSDENIFVIPTDPGIYRYYSSNCFLRTLHYIHGEAFGMGSWNGSCATIEMMQAMGYATPDIDPRMDMSFYTGKVQGPDGNYIKGDGGVDFEYLPLRVKLQMQGSDEEKRAGARWKKYELDRQFQGAGEYFHNDWVLFRYADVMLMKAEAELRLGNTMPALSLVNEIRGRVKATPLLALTLDDLLKERMIELSWEAWRRNDRVRFGAFTKTYTDKQASSPYRIVFPIPEDVLSSNKNMSQNPGYK